MKVTKEMVEYWLVEYTSNYKYEDALSKLTDLINEKCTYGNSDTIPTMEYLREDILDLWGEFQYDIKNRGEEA